ncbi:MAG: tripartite tricarboxylate transporter permease [Peptococcaceae bacterium]|jgi:putative tricarboxylic transport membrane protein|nr:tripartite tricarboxylate transporter permease [Peptococcaceae bacterium]
MEGLLNGFAIVLTPMNLLFALAGVFLGTLVGVLPGIGPVGSMALLLGATYGLPPETAIIMFAGIYYGSMYGGSTTSILINIPGEASAVVTAIDGNKMAKRGRAGAALSIAAIGSFIAGTIGIVLLTFLAPTLARFALRFGPPEYFCIALFGLVTLSQISGQAAWKSFIMVGVGLLIGAIGVDVITGATRMTFGLTPLQKGIDFVPLAMGFFGITEVLEAVESKVIQKADVIKVRMRELLPNREEARRSAGPIARGSFLGFFVGLLPGPAGVISTFISYFIEKKLSKKPEEFGEGAIEGVAGPESANNSAAVGAFVPLLSLGIPFSPPTAMLLTAMLIHGITPGPLLLSEHPQVFWGLIASMYIGNFMLILLNLPLVGLFVKVLKTPVNLLMPIITILCIIGAYALNNSVVDVILMIIAGIVGYGLKKLSFSTAPMVLALVIGPMMENSLRQSLLIAQSAGFTIFLTRPITRLIVIVTLAIIVAPPIIKIINLRGRKKHV